MYARCCALVCALTRTLAVFAIVFTAISNSNSFADELGSLETYAHWIDVTNLPSSGSWTKLDSPNPVVTQGELVVAPAHGTAVPRTGAAILDLRTESVYASGGDGANYNYAINSDDFGGTNPSSVNSGIIDFDYWICPNTWSGDANFFTPAGIYQTTSLLNSSGDIVASIGMHSLGNQNSPEVHYSVDGVNWISTGLLADSSTWTNVSMSIDLDAMTSTIGFTDSASNSHVSSSLAWDGSITDTSVSTLNLQMIDGVGKNYFDDFSFSVAPSAVPEPSSAALAFVGLFVLATQRRRKA